jgi:Na+/H+ antiporter NhaD/arsenite permease-like protein
MLGAVVFLITGILDDSAITRAPVTGDDTIALLFGGMVVARVLVPTGIFEVVGRQLLHFTKGSGKRLLLALPHDST